MQMLPLILMGTGTIMSAYGSYQQGKALNELGEYKASQYEAKSTQERAKGQHSAEKQRRRTKLAQSRAQALAASSGAGATDPTAAGIMADLAGEGELNAQYEIYKGEDGARMAKMGADVSRFEGAQFEQAGKIGAFSTILQGAGMGLSQYNTMMGKYAPSPEPSLEPTWV